MPAAAAGVPHRPVSSGAAAFFSLFEAYGLGCKAHSLVEVRVSKLTVLYGLRIALADFSLQPNITANRTILEEHMCCVTFANYKVRYGNVLVVLVATMAGLLMIAVPGANSSAWLGLGLRD